MKTKFLLASLLIFSFNTKPFSFDKNFYQNVLPKLVFVQNLYSLYNLVDFYKYQYNLDEDKRNYYMAAKNTVMCGLSIITTNAAAQFMAKNS